MGALIILHGLFLLHCNGRTTMVNSLQPQTCEILSAQTPGHSYRVGANAYVVLPFSTNLAVTLVPSVNKNPDTGRLASRAMMLESSVVTVPGQPTLRIVVPMPDDIYGANVLRAFRDDVLNGTNPDALRSPAGSDNRIAIAESLILSYSAGQAFSLTDGGTVVSGASSALMGQNQVLAFFSWPVASDKSCSTTAWHAPLNSLLQVNGQQPSFQLMGLGAISALDDAAVSGFNLPDTILRPPCVTGLPMKMKGPKPKVSRTAIQTGCGPEIDIEE